MARLRTLLLLVLVARAARAARGRGLEDVSPLYGIAAAGAAEDSICAHSLRLLRDAADHRLPWALKMLDSSGCPGSGFLWGNNFWLGSRGQCEDINNHAPYVLTSNSNLYDRGSDNITYPPFGVHFLVASFLHNASLQMHINVPNENLLLLGMCVPEGCAPDHLHHLIEDVIERAPLLLQRTYKMDLTLLQIRDLRNHDKWLWEPGFLIVATAVSVLLLLLTIGTIYDVTTWQPFLNEQRAMSEIFKRSGSVRLKNDSHKHYSQVGRFFLNFSIYTNTSIVFNTALGAEVIPAIHGLRFLGMCWILMAHTIYYLCDFADNKPMIIRLSEGFFAQVLGNAVLSVDTFFFLSGFLVSYLFYKAEASREKKEPASFLTDIKHFLSMVLRRFIRLTPPYMLIMGIVYVNAAWYRRTSLFSTAEQPDLTCAQFWWRNLLYINNLFSRREMCMSWSWYLSNDMQFFIAASFLLIISKRSFSASVGLLFSMIVISSLATGYSSYIHNYIPTLDNQYQMLDILYDRPWARVGPHLVGVATGFLVAKLNGKLKLGKATIVFFWIVGSTCNIVALFGLCERRISPIAAAIYISLSRTAWGIGIAWIVIACSTNHGGIINKILSFRGWVPLSRITYCAYLINPMLMSSVYLSSSKAQHIEFLPTGTYFLGHVCICYCCAYVISMLIESPTILLMKQLLTQRSSSSRNTHL